MKVLEMYPAVQGEGIFTGVPSTFIRLAGCTVGCTWCDTKYSWRASQGTDMTPEEIYVRAKKLTTHSHVVLTGGEPLEHPQGDVIELIRLLQTQHFVTIETSGTIPDPRSYVPQTRARDGILWSIAPKLFSAKSTKPFPDLAGWMEAARLMGHKMQWKFVVATRDDFDEFIRIVEDVDQGEWIDPGVVTVILQVATNTGLKETEKIRSQVLTDLQFYQETIVNERLLAKLPNLRILPQLHAMIYGTRRGV